jgi:acyl carrier protein
MVAGLGGVDRARLERSGLVELSDEDGAEVFDAAVLSGVPAVLGARLDVTALDSDAVPLWRHLARPAVRRQVADAGMDDGMRATLAGMPAAERERALEELVRAEAAVVLGHGAPDALAGDRPFRDLGFDSLTAVELRNRLTGRTGVALPASAIFDYPSVPVLAERLSELLFPPEDDLAALDALLGRLGSGELREAAEERLRAFLGTAAGQRDTTTGHEDEDASLSEVLHSSSFSELKSLLDAELGYRDEPEHEGDQDA